MKAIFRAALIFAAATAAGAVGAQAGVVIQDDFTANGQTPTLNWAGDATFTSLTGGVNASVDLVAPSNPYGITSFDPHLNVVDMDGTTDTGLSPSGILQSTASLSAGNYTVSFELSGNQRGYDSRSLTVSIGGKSVTFGPLASDAGWVLESYTFDGVSGNVTFSGSGPSNNVGDLLGNVSVSTAAPEVSTWAMMLLGFAGIGLAGVASSRRKGALAV